MGDGLAIRVTWDAIEGVDYYKVEYKTNYTYSSNYEFETATAATTLDFSPPEFPNSIYAWRFGVRPCTNSACDVLSLTAIHLRLSADLYPP